MTDRYPHGESKVPRRRPGLERCACGRELRSHEEREMGECRHCLVLDEDV